MRARQHAEPDGIGVLLQRGGHHLLGRLVQSRVDDLEAGVAEGARHDLRPAVVAVEPRLGDHDPYRALGHAHSPTRSRTRSPTAMICARSPGTGVQSKPLPSLFQRGMRCRWKWNTDWKAAAPLACSTLSPSGFSASRSALDIFWAVAMAAWRSSTSDSQRVPACALVSTRQCPFVSGLMSMMTSVRSSSYTFMEGSLPSRILQKTHSSVITRSLVD